MTLKEALKEICLEQVPQEINGISTKWLIADCTDVFGYKCVNITLMPVHIKEDNVAVSTRINDETWTVGYPIEKETMAWGYLKSTIQEMLCAYIHNIIERYNGQIVEETAIF